MRVIILGEPGCGKGTQAKKLAEHFNLKQISSGDVFRGEYERKTDLGLKAHGYWGKGKLVPDDITIPLVEGSIPSDRYILDGYPRTIAQAKSLDEKRETDFIVYLKCDRNELRKRLLNRAGEEGRHDDKKAIIEERFRIYDKETKPLLEHYSGKITEIDGNVSIDRVFSNIIRVLESSD